MSEEATPVDALIEEMIDAGRDLPPALRQALISAGPAAVPGLLRVLEDEALSMADARGGGNGPIHAVEVLGELRPPEAIEPMLRLLRIDEPLSILLDRVGATLPAWGAAVFEPGMRALEEESDPDVQRSLLGVLAEVGVKDERLFERLVAELAESPSPGAMHLADYGDPRAIEHLERAAVGLRLGEDEGLFGAAQDVIEVVAAIKKLGGTPSAAVAAQLAAVKAKRESFFQRIRERVAAAPTAAAKASPKVGRNDPCPCGSGKKFKKCHIGKALG